MDDLGDVSNQSVRAIAKLADSDQVLSSVLDLFVVCSHVCCFIICLLFILCLLLVYSVCLLFYDLLLVHFVFILFVVHFVSCFSVAGSSEEHPALHGGGEKKWK